MMNYYTDYERLKDMILFHTPFYEKLSAFILKFDISHKLYVLISHCDKLNSCRTHNIVLCNQNMVIYFANV